MSAYIFDPAEKGRREDLGLPKALGELGQLDLCEPSDEEPLRAILNEVLDEGLTYPFFGPMDPDQFRAYFLAASAFVVRSPTGEVLGGFYVKPNFPGRCSHICNGGFIVGSAHRGKGVGRAMAKEFLILAKKLKFEAVMFNLVFETNLPSLHLWRTMGFKELGVIPNAGKLKGGKVANAHMFHYDLTKD